jgi:hypothetical protein
MHGQNVIRTLVFVVFFSTAAASLSVSVLCGDLVRYYQSKHLLKEARQSLEQLKSLNADYDALLKQLESDPNLIKRIAPVTLGVEPGDANAIYPRAKADATLLWAARKALAEDPNRPKTEPPIPQWLARCSKPRQRAALFLISAALIVVSFVCFGPVKQAPKKQDRLPES